MTLQFQSVLAAVDLSPATATVVSRAAMLAAKHGVVLRVMNVSGVCKASRAADSLDLAAIACAAAERFDVRIEVLEECASSAMQVAQRAGQRGLVVVNYEQRVSLSSFWRGSLVDQLLRVLKSPLLVVKARTAVCEGYQRVLVAVDLTPAATDLVAIACCLNGNGTVQILHSIRPLHSNPLRDAEMPQRILRAYLNRRKIEAHEELLRVTRASLKCQRRVETFLREGEPARHASLQQSDGKADLVIVGKRRSSALSDALHGGVAKRILAWCGGDILVVPLRMPPQNQELSQAAVQV